MSNTVSKFMQTGKTYIDKAAYYLEERGLTIEDVAIKPYLHVDNGYGLLDKDGNFTPFIPEGWAYMVRRHNGEYHSDRWLLRVCNWPQEPVFQKKRAKGSVTYNEVTKPPKFINVPAGADILHYASTANELCNASLIMFHEKFTSAALAKKHLGIPSLALSGCTNWSQDKQMKEELSELVKLLKQDCKIVVCFDGDILDNPNVMHAASQLKGWIFTLRPDIEVMFPAVPNMPEGLNGWDDWAVLQGPDLYGNWLEVLSEGGVDVTTALPVVYLINKYNLKFRVDRKNETLKIEHTAANYAKLLEYPLWQNYVQNIDKKIYDINNIPAGPATVDSFYDRYEAWLADSVFVGDGASVRMGSVKQAVRQVMERRQISVPVHILSKMADVSEEQAMSAAYDLITQGIEVTGPMTQEETCKTFLRVCRDIVALWTNDPLVDVQWALALVGPSGCGKSNFPKSFLGFLYDYGYPPSIAQLAKDGARSSLTELSRQVRDSLVGVFDEYDPDDSIARDVERNLFTLSSMRSTTQREAYAEGATECIRHAFIMLTTVDSNRTYIRSAKDAGERRFITMEVKGVKWRVDRMVSDRAMIKKCGATMLRYGYQMLMAGDTSDATEFSERTTGNYLSESAIMSRLGQNWGNTAKGAANIEDVLMAFGSEQKREPNNMEPYWAFTLPQFVARFMNGEKLSRMDRSDLRDALVACGAERKAGIRVNVGEGKSVQKDEGLWVSDWQKFCETLIARI